MNRRKLLTGLISFVAAPAIVRAATLMPIAGETYRIWRWECPLLPDPLLFGPPKPDAALSVAEMMKPYLGPSGRLFRGTWTFFGKTGNIYSDEMVAFSKVEYPPSVILSAVA